jgi:hypothetical protein
MMNPRVFSTLSLRNSAFLPLVDGVRPELHYGKASLLFKPVVSQIVLVLVPQHDFQEPC